MNDETFKCTDYHIPEDKFDYIQKMVKDNDVTLTITAMPDNPEMCIDEMQQCEELRANKLSTMPRKMSTDMYLHDALVLICRDCVRKISMSTPKNVFDNDNNLIVNPQIALEESIPKDILPLYRLIMWFGTLRTFWKHFVANNIYQWAEEYEVTNLLSDEDSYIYRSFEYSKDTTQSLIDIFGYDVIEKAMNDLLVCPSCGE